MYVATDNIWFTTSIYEMQMNGLGKKQIIKEGMSGSILMCYDSDSKTLFVNNPFGGYIWMYSAEGLHSNFCKRFKSYFTNFNKLYYYINRLNFII